MVAFIVGLAVTNIFFFALLQGVYVAVARRRWRIFMLVEHLAALAQNGMPIHAGLRAIGRDLGGFLGSRLGRVAEAVEEGRSLGEAFEKAPRAFPSLLRSTLALGEKSGNLVGFLQELKRSYKRIADLPHQSLYIFLYPLILSVVLNAVLTGVYFGIVPKFQVILTQMGMRDTDYMPLWSRLVIANEAVLALCVAMFMFIVMGGSSIHFGSSVFRWMKGGVDRVVLLLPVLGRMARDGAVQQFALCTGLYLRSGASLPEAVRAAAGVERNGILRGRLDRVAHAIGEGGRLSAALRSERIGETDLVWFVETGEASGLLSDHLLLAATHYETKVRLAARIAARSVVPAFVLLNGLVVGTAFYLTFLPLRESLRAMIKS